MAAVSERTPQARSQSQQKCFHFFIGGRAKIFQIKGRNFCWLWTPAKAGGSEAKTKEKHQKMA